MMNTTRRITGSALLSTMFVIFTAVPLWQSGFQPERVSRDLLDAFRGAELKSQREVAVLGALFVVWVLLALIALHAVGLFTRVVVQVGRILARHPEEHGTRRALRAIMIFALGVVSTSQVVDRTQGAGSTLLTQHPHDDRLVPDMHKQILPALASAGLALGLTTHLQRERAVLLRDAPVTARLRRPTVASLARGTAVFERAREWHDSAAPSGGSTAISLNKSNTNSWADGLLIPLGRGVDCLVQLHVAPGDTIAIAAPANEALTVLRHVVNTLALAPWLDQPLIVICGFSASDVIVSDSVVIAESPQDAVSRAQAQRAGAPTRAVIVITSTPSSMFDRLAVEGITLITAGGDQREATTRVIREDHAWRISPQDDLFLPYGVTAQEAADFRHMVHDLTQLENLSDSHSRNDAAMPNAGGEQILLRVIGPIEVSTSNGAEVVFRKSKSLELLCWLGLHRERPTVSAARTALWEINVSDATFHNVLSELRRALAARGIKDAVQRATKHRLVLDSHIVTDAEMFRNTLVAVADTTPSEHLSELCELLSLVRGLPFAGENYAWADAEGITSTLVWLVTRAVDLAAQSARELGDEAALLEATSAGLRMMPGDEHFTALRETVVPNPTS